MLEKINYLTAGESHGRGLLGIIEGIPSNLEIDENFIREPVSYTHLTLPTSDLL